MTEKQEPTQEQQEEARQILHPLYVAAEADSWLKINFVGNTPVIAGYDGSFDITPYHMLGAAEDMKRKAFQMIQFAEIKEAEERKRQEAMGIQKTGRMPDGPLTPGGFKHGG